MFSDVPVGFDGAPGLAVGLNGVVACIGDGDGSGVPVALLAEMPGVCLVTREV
ncbi:MAG: hypothetical protein M3036_03335 [Bifidobacteriales bacterium]|nr:hypothetical protein [Bifidobacteriales bacterium]